MKTLFYLVLVNICAVHVSIAQSVSSDIINSTGFYYNSSNISVDVSIGETAIETYSQSSVLLTQGFLQPKIDLNNNTNKTAFYKIKYFPNPVENELYIDLGNLKSEFTVAIYTVTGALVSTAHINEKMNKIQCSEWSSGNYFVRVFNNEFSQSFLINKK